MPSGSPVGLPVQVRCCQGHWHRDGIMFRVIPARGARRRVFAVTTLVVAAFLLVWLTLWLWQQDQVGAERANILALSVAIVAALLAAVATWFAFKDRRPSPSLVDVMRGLMRLVRNERQRFIDQALGVPWNADPADVTYADPESGKLPTEMETLLVNWQDVDGKRAGSVKEVADFYRNETNGRLVVLGAPGSGKSMLLSHLVRDLVDGLSEPGSDRPPDWRLPIMISLSGCDLGEAETATKSKRRMGEQGPSDVKQLFAARLDTWIVKRLVEDYQVREDQANALVSNQRILPVLDGLDEMDPSPTPTPERWGWYSRADDDSGLDAPPRAAAVIQALNADRTTPVVLACREVEYQGLTVDRNGAGPPARRTSRRMVPSKPGVLTDARHVVLRPLSAQDVKEYLTNRFSRTQVLPNRWQGVADALDAGKPLLRVLQNPWQLFLAVKAYWQETSDPAELIRMDPDQANEQLLSALIPAVTDADDTAEASEWTAADVRRWLTTIADHLSASVGWSDSLTDIRLPDLWNVAGHARSGFAGHATSGFREWIGRLITPIIAATPTLLVAIAFILVGLDDRGGFLFVGFWLAILGLFFGVVAYDLESPPMFRFDLGQLRTPMGRRLYLVSVAFAALKDAVIGLALALLFVLGSWYLAVMVEEDWDRSAFWRRLESALGSGGEPGLMNWLESVLLPPLESVVIAGLVFGLVVGLVQGFIENLQGRLKIAPSPSVLAGQCIRFHTAYGLASGLVLGVGTGVWSGQRLGPVPGLALGLATGLALGLGCGLMYGGWGWLRYAIGVRAAIRQRLLPRRPAGFLDWCLRAGLMRMSGSSLQFRHRQLQDWLTSPAEPAAQAELQARWRQSAARH